MAELTIHDMDIDIESIEFSTSELNEIMMERLSDLSSLEVEEVLNDIGFERPIDEDILADLYDNCLSTSEQKAFLSQIGAMEMDSTDLGRFTQLYDNLEDQDKTTFRERLDLADYDIDQVYKNLTEPSKKDFQMNHDLTTNAVYDELFSKVRNFFEIMRELNLVTKP